MIHIKCDTYLPYVYAYSYVPYTGTILGYTGAFLGSFFLTGAEVLIIGIQYFDGSAGALARPRVR